MKAIFKFVLTLTIIILLIFVGIPRTVAKVARYKESKNIFIDTSYTREDYLESLKNEPSEIKGLTKYDKYEMGLAPYTDDTDSDGLTDDEEINIYHSDPTKKSTADDFYSDKYKVDNGMDIKQKYDHEGELTYEWNMCPEVSLKAENINDLDASIKEKSLPGVEDLVILKAYTMYNYSGEIGIDVSEIVKNSGISIDDINIYKNTLSDPEVKKLGYIVDDNMIHLKERLDYDDVNYIYLVDKNSETKLNKPKRVLSDLNMLYIDDYIDYESTGIKAIVKVKPFWGFAMNWIFNTQAFAKIYYVDSGNAEVNEKALQQLIDQVNYMYAVRKGFRNPFTLNSKCIKCVSQEKYESLLLGCRTLDPDGTYKFEGDVKNQPAEQFFLYCYWTYDDTYSFEYDYSTGHQVSYYENNPVVGKSGDLNFLTDSAIEEENGTDSDYQGIVKKRKKKFDLDYDVFLFGNFASKYSPNGSCLGVCTLTSRLYNTGYVEPEGRGYAINNEYVYWDLSSYDDNKTLMDPGLADYKDRKFVRERGGTEETPVIPRENTGEEEFFKMIGSYHYLGNAIWHNNCYRYRTIWNNAERYEDLDSVLEYLDSGKVVIVGLSNDVGSHAILAYDYYFDRNGDAIRFMIYANNLRNTKGLLMTIEKTDSNGSFEFGYNSGLEDYCFSSADLNGLFKEYSIIFMDESFNVLYPKEKYRKSKTVEESNK